MAQLMPDATTTATLIKTMDKPTIAPRMFSGDISAIKVEPRTRNSHIATSQSFISAGERGCETATLTGDPTANDHLRNTKRASLYGTPNRTEDAAKEDDPLAAIPVCVFC
jgi:hypothetical protein